MVRTTFATPQLFETLGVRPILGRTFRDDENVHGGDLRKVVLGYGLWREAFGGSSDVIGRQIQIRDRPHEVIGVLPPRFDYPDRTQVWMPLMSRYFITEVWWKRRDLYRHGVIARRRPDVTIAQAQADMDAIARRLAEEYPATNRDTRVRVRHLREAEVGQLGSQIRGVTAAAVLLFLLGCVNVSGLFVARAAGRAQEVAVRTALGAEPRRLMRQHVVEGLLYGLLGGVAGVAVAAAAIPALYALIPVDLPAWMQFRFDQRTIAFAASAGAGTGLLISTTSLAWHRRSGACKRSCFLVFGAVAVVLTSVGLFAVMSYLVAQRTREFGVRTALGANRSDIVGTVLRHGAGIAAVGTVCGLLVALAMGSYLDALLFRVSRFDLVTFSSVPIVICMVTLIACALPAWRASRVDPLIALRD